MWPLKNELAKPSNIFSSEELN